MLVHAAEIAGHEPAFPVQRHRGGGWAVEIPAHHAIAADLDLADLAQRQAWEMYFPFDMATAVTHFLRGAPRRAWTPWPIYARELTRWGIETSIIVPGAFTTGTNHFAHSGRPADEARVAEYEAGPNKGLGEKILEAFGAIVPPDADASAVALLSWTGSAQKCRIDSASEICSFQQRALQNSCHETLAF
jgi:hypothetical protein